MNKETTELEEITEPQFVPASKWERILYAFITIAMPIISFAITYDDILNPDWQDGHISSYAGILLGGTVSRYFFPFLIYAIIAFGLLLFAPKGFSRSFFIRLGIYTGGILALQYVIILSVFTNGVGAIIAIVGGLALFFSTRFLYRKFGVKKTVLIYIAFFLGFYAIWALATDFRDALSALSLVVIFFFATAPFAVLVIATLTSWHLQKEYPFSRKEVLGLGAWLFPYVAAWRLAILKMMEVYSSLPTQPPCYIATAAAKGHPRFVKSEPVLANNGKIININPQLRYLKFAEICLVIIVPSFHKILRKIYDLVGKKLAQRINHPLLADMAYLMLKPFEWGTRFVMKALFPNLNQIAMKIYQGK
ncbi:MAG: hypothetical protein GY755_13975 [Chloroflexi bacterium]|nr:hypothetical protein [Chloroflexota bacterium]